MTNSGADSGVFFLCGVLRVPCGMRDRGSVEIGTNIFTAPKLVAACLSIVSLEGVVRGDATSGVAAMI